MVNKINKAQKAIRDELIETSFLTAEDFDILEEQKGCASCAYCQAEAKNVFCTKNIAKNAWEMAKTYKHGCICYQISYNAFMQETKKLEKKYPQYKDDALILDVVSNYLSIDDREYGEA